MPVIFNGTLVAGANILSVSSVNLPDYIILDSWLFENSILLDQPFAKPLQSFEIFVLVNNNLWVKLVSSLELLTVFDERFEFISVLFLIPDFSLLSCELDNFIFKVLYWVILH